jgi:sn-glycerol 3-phosphate transport system substrate-binding protein
MTNSRPQQGRAHRACWLILLLLTAALLGASCKGGAEPTGNGKTPPSGPITITLWHSMRSPVDGVLQGIIDRFNASQSTYKVQAIYQGSYTDSTNKLISSINSGNIPALIQLDDVSTQLMIDSQEITPVQKFIDEDKYDLSDFDPKALAYYRVGGKLHSMPFNLAEPILYYDKQDFIDAGLDPDKPPQTLDEVRADSEKLTKRDASGKITRYGIAVQSSPWFFEQMLAKQGALSVNNSNGRDGRATQAVFDGQEGQSILQWHRDMVRDGLAYYAGSSEDALLSVAQDRTSMTIETTAVLGSVVKVLTAVGLSAQRMGTGPMPAPAPVAGKQGGIVLGGASMWILKRTSADEQLGAWEFIKFASSPEQQAQWYADTGYFPTRLSAYTLPPAIQIQQQYPQFKTAVEQVRNSPDNPATQGPLMGPFNQVRDRVTRAFEEVLTGGADPEKALQSAAKDATKDMQDYNRTVK